MRVFILAFCLLFFHYDLIAQINPPTVIIKDEAKLGVLVTGEGNSINVTQTILPKSQEYAILQADSVRLHGILQEIDKELEAAQDNEQWLNSVLKNRALRGAEYHQLLQQMHDFKADVLQLAATFNKIKINSKRIQRAKELFEAGKIRGADAVLNTSEMEVETDALLTQRKREQRSLAQTDSLLDVKAAEWLIKAQTTRIHYELTTWYDSTDYYFRRSIQCRANASNNFQYALFLQKHKQLDSSLVYYQLASEQYILEKDTVNYLATQNNLGVLYSAKNEYAKAENAYLEALEIYQRLATTNPATYEPDVAGTQNNLGTLYGEIDEYAKAESVFLEALETYKRLATSNSATYEPDVAGTQNNLGVLYSAKNEYPKAESAFVEALEIYQRLARSNSATYEPDVAMTQNNLGNLHCDKSEYAKAESAYLEALEIHKRLATTNPAIYEPEMAMTQNNLGTLYRAKNEYAKAESAYLEALEISKRLATTNPATYESEVAMTQNNLGNLHCDKNKYAKAESAYLEALEIYQRLATSNSATYEPDVAGTQNNLGTLYGEINEYAKAESVFLEALETYKRLATTNPTTYEPYMAAIQNNLGILYMSMDRSKKADSILNDALNIYRQYAMLQPNVYEIEVARSAVLLARSKQQTGTSEKAVPLFQEALGIADKNLHIPLAKGLSNEVIQSIGIDIADPIFFKWHQKIEVLMKAVERQIQEKNKVTLQDKVVEAWEEAHQENPNNPRIRNYLAQNQGTLSWYQLFAQNCTAAEKAARRGLELDESESWIFKNLSTSLVLQERFEEAVPIYQHFKGQPYDQERSWAEVFLADLEELESAGITHPDVEKVRALLAE